MMVVKHLGRKMTAEDKNRLWDDRNAILDTVHDKVV